MPETEFSVQNKGICYRQVSFSWRIFMRRKVALLGFFLAVATLLSGCGKQDEELENYKKSMETFFSNVDILNDSINSIDPYAEDASEKLLKQLDLFETSIDFIKIFVSLSTRRDSQIFCRDLLYVKSSKLLFFKKSIVLSSK